MPIQNLPPLPEPLPAGSEPSLRLLVLDDLQFDRRLVRRMCERMGLDVIIDEANSLRELAQRLPTRRYDLILIDHWLPDGDGFSALKMVQDDPQNCHSITIVVTRDANPALATAVLRSGCSDYMEKDQLSPLSLQRALQSAVRARESQLRGRGDCQTQTPDTHSQKRPNGIVLPPPANDTDPA